MVFQYTGKRDSNYRLLSSSPPIGFVINEVAIYPVDKKCQVFYPVGGRFRSNNSSNQMWSPIICEISFQEGKPPMSPIFTLEGTTQKSAVAAKFGTIHKRTREKHPNTAGYSVHRASSSSRSM